MSYHIMKQGNNVTAYLQELVADNISDLETLPSFPDCAIGSRCLIIENSQFYILGNDNKWHILNQGSQPTPTPTVLTKVILKDIQTGILYKLGIDNGLIYLDDDVEPDTPIQTVKITDDATGVEYTLKVDNQKLLIESEES